MLLEEGRFRNKAANFMFMLIFGIMCMVILACIFDSFSKIRFLGHSLSFMMVYVWGRGKENANVRISLLGLYTFNAPYLPWVLLGFSLCLGNPIETDFLGIVVGHLYYFLDYVYPQVAASRGWSCKRILVTPSILNYLFGNDDFTREINQTRVFQF
jgi:Derlin-2/3